MPQEQVCGAVCEHYKGLTFIIESKWSGILPGHYFFVILRPFSPDGDEPEKQSI
jgi:hypothetical protein